MITPLVLIVESNPFLRDVLADLVRLENLATVTAGDGPGGLASIYQHHPDLLITTSNLHEGISSLDLLRAIRNDPLVAPLPVLLLVSETMDQSLPVDDDRLLILKQLDLDHARDGDSVPATGSFPVCQANHAG